ncbi:MAG TPA: CvpA family protein [Candidatus Faecimonas intestinavium]|nr:CvpA family protein [Candidatus Faecimonas intestinavium]
MNILDIVIALVLIMSAIIGFKRGAIKEVVSLVGIIIVFILAFSLKGVLGNVLCKWLPFFNFAGNLEGVTVLNILLYQLIAFLIIYSLLFSVYMIVVKISGIVQKIVHMTVILWLPSKLIGAVVAFITGYVMVFVVLLALLIPLKDTDIFKNSKFANYIVYDTPILASSSANISTSINEIYELGEDLSKGDISKNEANVKTMDILLKYKVVSAETARELVVLDKLDGISGLDKVIEKYE